MRIDIEFDEKDAKALLEALDCHRKNWALYLDAEATDDYLSDKIKDAFREHGIELDDEEDY